MWKREGSHLLHYSVRSVCLPLAPPAFRAAPTWSSVTAAPATIRRFYCSSVPPYRTRPFGLSRSFRTSHLAGPGRAFTRRLCCVPTLPEVYHIGPASVIHGRSGGLGRPAFPYLRHAFYPSSPECYVPEPAAGDVAAALICRSSVCPLLPRFLGPRVFSSSTPCSTPPQWGRLNTGGRRLKPSSGVLLDVVLEPSAPLISGHQVFHLLCHSILPSEMAFDMQRPEPHNNKWKQPRQQYIPKSPMAAQGSIGPLRLLKYSLTLTPNPSLLWVLQTAEIRCTKLDISQPLSAPPAPAEACLQKRAKPQLFNKMQECPQKSAHAI